MKKHVSVLLLLALLLMTLAPASAATAALAPAAESTSADGLGSREAALTLATFNPVITALPSISPSLLLDISGDFTDPAFLQAVWEWLGNTGTPGIIFQSDIDDRLVTKGFVLNVSNKGISSLAGLEHFTSLVILFCDRNNLTELPDLPQYVNVLDCSYNQLTSLPEIRDGFVTLSCGGNKLTALPTLPDSLNTLYCEENKLTDLPALPANLIQFACVYNNLGTLGALPTGLKMLACTGCGLDALPDLPDSLTELYCNENALKELPASLPSSLTALDCQRNLLTDIEADVSGLTSLNCAYNYMQTFYGTLSSKLAVVPTLTKTPQYRISYATGAILALDIGQTRDPVAGELKQRFSADNTVWGDVSSPSASSFTWLSSNNAIAKVDSSGAITGVGEGSCVIIGRYKDIASDFTSVNIPVEVSGETYVAPGSGGSTEPDPGTGTGGGSGSGSGAGTGSSDIDWMSASSWAVPELEQADALGLFTDKVKDNLTQDITREEFCGIAVKLYEGLTGETAVPAIPNPFTDTSDQDILKAYELGIVKGVGTGKFAPDNRITRQEICVMLHRALLVADPSIDFSTSGVAAFADESKIASWAINSVRFASKNGIMKGTGAGFINPLANTSREQGIVLVKRTYDKFD